MSARSTIRVLAFGMSRPDSTIVVQTRTSNSFSQKPTMTRSSASSFICPWPTATRASGTSSRSRARRPLDRLDPVVQEEDLARRAAARGGSPRPSACSSYAPTKVSTGCRSSGGVRIVDISRMPVSDISSVRGIGVADIVSTSTDGRSCFRYSLCSTPKRCSSSTIDQAEVLEPGGRSAAAGACRSTMSTAPSASPVERRLGSRFGLRSGTASGSFTGNCAIRSEKVLKCCWASSVVGTRTATCLPSCTALNAARTAISVLP